MNSIQHPSNNRVIGAPRGWRQDLVECRALPITDMVIDDMQSIVSYWKPTADELRMLVEGGSVWLAVMSGVMPPVMLGVDEYK